MVAHSNHAFVGRNFFRARPEMVPLDLELVAHPNLTQRGPLPLFLSREQSYQLPGSASRSVRDIQSWEIIYSANLRTSDLRTRPSAVLAENRYYDLADLACFRNFAQRSRCASAIRRRASLLKVRFALLGMAPLVWPSTSNAFPTRSSSFWRRVYSVRREVTTLFRLVIDYPLMQ